MAEEDIFWDLTVRAVRAQDSRTFLELIVHSLQEKGWQFHKLQSGLQARCLTQVPPDAALKVTCEALSSLLPGQADSKTSKAAAHVLLEAFPQSLSNQVSPQAYQAASSLFSLCCSSSAARIAVKVAQAFDISWDKLQSQQQCKELLQELLDSGSYTPVLGLLQHFQELQEGVNLRQVLMGLVQDGQLGPAQAFAGNLPQTYRSTLVQDCADHDRLREAVKFVKHFKLKEEFPNMEDKYRQQTLTKLLERGQWSLAVTHAGKDVDFQEQTLRAMVLAGELVYAEELRQQLGLPETVLDINTETAAAQFAAREASFMQLALPWSVVHFVDTDEAVARMSFEGVYTVGLDVEWKPDLISGASNPASLLQVASRSAVWIIDLISLHGSPLLQKRLRALMQDNGIVKLGCQLSDDMSKLHRSYPGMQAFQHATALLNLSALWAQHAQLADNGLGLQGRRKRHAVGLSAMTNSTLGKPLNKAMQMSDWERRPLSERQLTYAALDAFVLLQIYDAIAHNFSTQQLQPYLFTFNGGRFPSRQGRAPQEKQDHMQAKPEHLTGASGPGMDSARSTDAANDQPAPVTSPARSQRSPADPLRSGFQAYGSPCTTPKQADQHCTATSQEEEKPAVC